MSADAIHVARTVGWQFRTWLIWDKGQAGTGTDRGLIDWESVFSAIYGDERIKFTVEEDRIVVGARGRLNFAGRLTPSPGSAPRHRTLSAAWLVRWRLRDDEIYAEVVHFPNPWAANPVRIMGRDIARVTFRWVNEHQVALLPPRRFRLLKVS